MLAAGVGLLDWHLLLLVLRVTHARRNKCMIIDRSIMQPGRVLKPGTLDFDGTPHQPFANLVRDANVEALQLHAAAVAGGR